MKRLLLAISAGIVALLCATSCDIDINVTVNAYAELMDLGSDVPVPTETLSFGPFTHYSLSEGEVDSIFRTLIKNSSKNFTAADLFLQYVDNIAGRELKTEHYGVVVQGNGQFDILLMDSQ